MNAHEKHFFKKLIKSMQGINELKSYVKNPSESIGKENNLDILAPMFMTGSYLETLSDLGRKAFMDNISIVIEQFGQTADDFIKHLADNKIELLPELEAFVRNNYEMIKKELPEVCFEETKNLQNELINKLQAETGMLKSQIVFHGRSQLILDAEQKIATDEIIFNEIASAVCQHPEIKKLGLETAAGLDENTKELIKNVLENVRSGEDQSGIFVPYKHDAYLRDTDYIFETILQWQRGIKHPVEVKKATPEDIEKEMQDGLLIKFERDEEGTLVQQKEKQQEPAVYDFDKDHVIDEEKAKEFLTHPNKLAPEVPFDAEAEDIKTYKELLSIPAINEMFFSAEKKVTKINELNAEEALLLEQNIQDKIDSAIIASSAQLSFGDYDTDTIRHFIRYAAAKQESMSVDLDTGEYDKVKYAEGIQNNRKYFDELDKLIENNDLLKSHLSQPVPDYNTGGKSGYLDAYVKNTDTYLEKYYNSFDNLSSEKKYEIVKAAEAAAKGHPYINGADVVKYFINKERDILRTYISCLDPEGTNEVLPGVSAAPFTYESIGRNIAARAKQYELEQQKEQKEPKKEEPKPVEEVKQNAEPVKEISNNKGAKKLKFTNQFIAKKVEKTSVENNQRIKSEGIDYGGVPIEIQMTNDVRYMTNWYALNKEKLSPEADAYFNAQYESARYFERLAINKESNKKTPTDMNVGFYDPDLKDQNEFEKGEYCIANLGKQKNQTTGSGCWSCAYENLLRSRGVEIPQEMIRFFRSNTSVNTMDELEGYKTDSLEKDSKGIAGKRNVALQYMTDTPVDIISRADLMLKVLPNTAMRTKAFSFPTEEMLKSAGVNEDTIDEKLLGNKMLETVRDAIGLSRSPVAVYFGGHYRTISSVNIEKRTIKWVDSMDQDPNAEREIKIDDLIAHCRTARPDASIEFTWMEDLVPDEKGICSVSGFEDYKYNENRLYHNDAKAQSGSDDYVKNGVLATKSIDDNNFMILETVCLPKNLISLSPYKQQTAPEIETSGKPYVYAEDPYPLPANEHILNRKPSAAPDKIEDLKIEDLKKKLKVYKDPEHYQILENINILVNNWDLREKYFPDEVTKEELMKRAYINNNKAAVAKSIKETLDKINREAAANGDEVLRFPGWDMDKLISRVSIMQDTHYKHLGELLSKENISTRFKPIKKGELPDRDHILNVEPLEVQQPVIQESDPVAELNRNFEDLVYEKIIRNNPDMYQIAFGLQYEPGNANEFREAAKNIDKDLLAEDGTRRNALRKHYKDWFKQAENLEEIQRLCTDDELTVLPYLDVERFLDKMSEMQIENLTRYNAALDKKVQQNVSLEAEKLEVADNVKEEVKEEIKKEEPQIAPVKEEIKEEEIKKEEPVKEEIKKEEPQIDPEMQEQIKQQVNVMANLQGLADDMLKQQLGDAYNPEEMKAVQNKMEAKFMKDDIYEALANEGIIKNVLGYGLGTRGETLNHLINLGKDQNVLNSQLVEIGRAMEALKPETMQRLFEQGKIKKSQLDYYNNNRQEFTGDAAVEYVQGEFYKKANSLADQLGENIPYPDKIEKAELVQNMLERNVIVTQPFIDVDGKFGSALNKLAKDLESTKGFFTRDSDAFKRLNEYLNSVNDFSGLDKNAMDEVIGNIRGLVNDYKDHMKNKPIDNDRRRNREGIADKLSAICDDYASGNKKKYVDSIIQRDACYDAIKEELDKNAGYDISRLKMSFGKLMIMNIMDAQSHSKHKIGSFDERAVSEYAEKFAKTDTVMKMIKNVDSLKALVEDHEINPGLLSTKTEAKLASDMLKTMYKEKNIDKKLANERTVQKNDHGMKMN